MPESTPRRIVGDDAARFLTKFESGPDEECWLWRRPSGNGYGYFLLQGKDWLAHRLMYVIANGPITEGLVLDHLCRTPSCVNPLHLEPVTQRENVRRGRTSERMKAIHAARTHCKNGHELTAENTYMHPKDDRFYRACRACQREREMRSRRKGVTS